MAKCSRLVQVPELSASAGDDLLPGTMSHSIAKTSNRNKELALFVGANHEAESLPPPLLGEVRMDICGYVGCAMRKGP